MIGSHQPQASFHPEKDLLPFKAMAPIASIRLDLHHNKYLQHYRTTLHQFSPASLQSLSSILHRVRHWSLMCHFSNYRCQYENKQLVVDEPLWEQIEEIEIECYDRKLVADKEYHIAFVFEEFKPKDANHHFETISWLLKHPSLLAFQIYHATNQQPPQKDNHREKQEKIQKKEEKNISHITYDYEKVFSLDSWRKGRADERSTQKLVDFLVTSGFNPPKASNALSGDHFYLHLRTLEGGDYHITASIFGFFINSSKTSAFNSSISGQHKVKFISLLELIQSVSEKYQTTLDRISSSPTICRDFEDYAQYLMANKYYRAYDIQKDGWLRATSPNHEWDSFKEDQPSFQGGAREGSKSRGIKEHGYCDWSEKFVRIRNLSLECPTDAHSQRRLSITREYRQLYREFEEAAIDGAVRLVEGKLKPINAFDVKDKQIYIYNKIFFSIAEQSIFSRTVQKGQESVPTLSAVNTDLLNLQWLSINEFGELKNRFHFLHFVVVQYQGFKVIGQIIIPGLISGDFNCCNKYGSIDDGDHIQTDPHFYEIMKEVCGKMGVRDDVKVRDLSGQVKVIAANPEVKGIRSIDHRNYVVDLFRLSPRDLNYQGNQNDACVLRKQLISQYLASNPPLQKEGKDTVKLNTNIGTNTRFIPDAQTESEEHLLKNIAQYIRVTAVPKLIEALKGKKGGEFLTESKKISEIFHAHGVNMRYLGFVHSHELLKNSQEIKDCLKRVILVKSLKHFFNLAMRETPRTQLSLTIAHLLNCVFGSFCALQMLEKQSSLQILEEDKIQSSQSLPGEGKKKKKKKGKEEENHMVMNLQRILGVAGLSEDLNQLQVKESVYLTMKPKEVWSTIRKICEFRFKCEFEESIEGFSKEGLFRLSFQKYAALRDLCLTIGIVLENKAYHLCCKHGAKITYLPEQFPLKCELPFRPRNIVLLATSAKKIRIPTDQTILKTEVFDQCLNSGFISNISEYIKSIPLEKLEGEDARLTLQKYEGKIEYMLGNYEKAALIERKRLSLLESVGRADSAELISSYSRVGLYLMSNQAYSSQALACLYLSLNLILLSYGEGHPDLLIHFANISTVHKMRREIAQASQCFLKAIEIFVAIYKNKFHPNISYCYTSLAMLYCSEQDMRKAVEYQTETVAILNQLLPEKDSRLQDASKILKMYKDMLSTNKGRITVERRKK